MLRFLQRFFGSDPIEAFQRHLGYRFNNPSLVEISLTHRSFANERGLDGNYERMEFLGDTVVGLITAEWLYRQHPDLAEGVETRKQLDALAKLHCHEAQGYLFSKPVPADSVHQLLQSPSTLKDVSVGL